MRDTSWLKSSTLTSLSGVLLWAGGSAQGMLWPILLFSLVPLLTALQRVSKKRAVFCGLLTGLIYNLLLLYWIVIVLGRYGGFPLYLSLPSLLLLALYMTIYVILFALAARFVLGHASPLLAVWGIPCIWVGLDWIRSFLFSGFPWMDLGYALWSIPQIIQVADLVGHYGVTFLLVLVNSLLAVMLRGRLKATSGLPLILTVVMLMVVIGFYSIMSWQQTEKDIVAAESAKIGVVQGNVEQNRKWLPEEQLKTVNTYLEQTDRLSAGGQVDMVVWPETALPFYPPNNPMMNPLLSLTHRADVAVLTGAPWYEIIDRKKRDVRFYNSSFLLLPGGGYGGQYHKTHLVPYGEYVPFKKLFPFLAPLVEAVGDFTPGRVGQPLQHGRIQGGVLICFESIFPEIARDWVKNGANVLVNLTNDAWYGKSSAPYQSFAMTVFRAVETRRSLVRAANTGISGFIDPLGRVTTSSQIFVPWAAAVDIALMEKLTFVVSYGYLFAPCCFFLGMFFLITLYMQRWKKSS